MRLPPGPRTPRAIQTWQWLRRPTEFLSACAARYGDVFTIRVHMDGDVVMTSNAAAIQQIFAATYDDVCQRKNAEFSRLVGYSSLFTAEGQDHRRMRRFLMPLFAPAQTSRSIPILSARTEEALDAWPLGRSFSLHAAMQELTLQTTLQSLLGEQCGPRVDALSRLFAATYTEFASPFIMAPIQWQSRLHCGPWARLVHLANQAGQIFADEVRQRRAAAHPRSDILAALMDARDPDGSALSDPELRDALITLVIAGHDTSANALSWAFTCLLDAPDLCVRLREELGTAVFRGALSWERVLALPLLDATVREVLRLHPIFPAVTRTLSRPMRLLGYDLPPGLRVAPCIYLAQRCADAFPEPDRFLPERFLNRRCTPYEWMPFGGGMRRCVGGAAVPVHLKVVLATVLGRAVLRPVPGAKVRTVRAFLLLSPSGGGPVVLTARSARQPTREPEPAQPVAAD